MSQPGITFYSNVITSGPFLADPAAADNYLPGPIQLDASQFSAVDAVTIVVGSAGAAQGATTVPVAALSGPIPKDVTIPLGGAKYARLSAAAAKGATSITVYALPTALVSGDTATYAGVGPLVVPKGTYIGRTQAEADAGTPFGPASASDDYRYLLGVTVNLRQTDGGMVVRHGRAVFENQLPEWATLSANSQLLAALRADYQCQKYAR
jgi:hypothetical protein